MTNEIKTFYDSLYADNPGVFGNSSVDFLAQVLDRFPSLRGTALDLGAGQGLTSNLLAERGFEVTAIDISNKAFQGVRSDLNIITSVTDVENFEPNTHYKLVHIGLVLHHLAGVNVGPLIRSLQNHTDVGGLHVLRLFTKNSDFFIKSESPGFYDDGVKLNEMYSDWSAVFDEVINVEASTVSALNEIRQVVFRKF